MSRLLVFACLLVVCLAQVDDSPKVDLVAAPAGGTPSKCYVCSTATHGDKCLNEKQGDPLPDLDQKNDVKDCPPKNGTSVCRKITQTVRDEVTVIRSCGYELWKGEEEICYKTLHQEFNTLVCTCKGTGDNKLCNSASGLTMSVMAVVATAVVAIMAS